MFGLAVWKRGAKNYSVVFGMRIGRKEGCAMNQDGTYCEMSRLSGEFRNLFQDMQSLRNLLDIQVETSSRQLGGQV